MAEKKKSDFGIGGKLNLFGLEIDFGEREFDLGVRERKTYRAKPGTRAPEEVEVRKPLVDIFYENGEIKVIAEMPGVEEKDIKINVEGKKLDLSADTPRWKYHKEIELDYLVEDEFKTSWRNGILEVILTKKP